MKIAAIDSFIAENPRKKWQSAMVRAHEGVYQLNTSLRNFYVHQIFDEFNDPCEEGIVKNSAKVVIGYIEIPNRPGLGIDLNVEWIGKHPYQQEHSLPLFKSGWNIGTR
jgi:L-alanine-DL-glutamate epimerase-like enolase superfamily enzyme